MASQFDRRGSSLVVIQVLAVRFPIFSPRILMIILHHYFMMAFINSMVALSQQTLLAISQLLGVYCRSIFSP